MFLLILMQTVCLLTCLALIIIVVKCTSLLALLTSLLLDHLFDVVCGKLLLVTTQLLLLLNLTLLANLLLILLHIHVLILELYLTVINFLRRCLDVTLLALKVMLLKSWRRRWR